MKGVPFGELGFKCGRGAQSSFFAKVTCVENWLPRLRILRHRCLVDLYHGRLDAFLFHAQQQLQHRSQVAWHKIGKHRHMFKDSP